MTVNGKKRKTDSDLADAQGRKRANGGKKWDMPRQRGGPDARNLQAGDVGIWATCSMHKEAPSVTDLRDLYETYASRMYGTIEAETDGEAGKDIENEILQEVQDLKKPATEPLFSSVKLSTQCLTFFKTRPPIDPVEFVHKICLDAADGVEINRCRFVKRFMPISVSEKATEKGLKDAATKVLAPHFHQPEQENKKYAIRVNIRNNKELKREHVIKIVAAAVGSNHTVDLSKYDLLIAVEIYQNILGMSVLGSDYEVLKRLNLSELRETAASTTQRGTTNGPDGVPTTKAKQDSVEGS